MIILDTNVVSEPIKSEPDEAVLRWLDEQDVNDVAITAVTAADLLYGVERLPLGQRRAELQEWLDYTLTIELNDKVVPFCFGCAKHYAELAAKTEQQGLAVSTADLQIASTCLCAGASLATRNVRHFTHTGVDLVNPWEYL